MTLPHSVCPDLTEFQYNALVDLASFPGVNEFSPSWLGPPVSQHLPWGQAAAIDVLNAASDIAPRYATRMRLLLSCQIIDSFL